MSMGGVGRDGAEEPIIGKPLIDLAAAQGRKKQTWEQLFPTTVISLDRINLLEISRESGDEDAGIKLEQLGKLCKHLAEIPTTPKTQGCFSFFRRASNPEKDKEKALTDLTAQKKAIKGLMQHFNSLGLKIENKEQFERVLKGYVQNQQKDIQKTLTNTKEILREMEKSGSGDYARAKERLELLEIGEKDLATALKAGNIGAAQAQINKLKEDLVTAREIIATVKTGQEGFLFPLGDSAWKLGDQIFKEAAKTS